MSIWFPCNSQHHSCRWGLAFLLVLLVAGCQRHRGGPEPEPGSPADPAASPRPPSGSRPPAVPQPSGARLPALDHEPALRVLVGRSGAVALLEPGRVEGFGTIPAGPLRALLGTQGIMVGSRSAPYPVTIRCARGDLAAFQITDVHGKRRFSGNLIVAREQGRLVFIEEVALDRYLVGVLAREMGADWPAPALAAQAVAARSYAASCWQERQDQPWQIEADENQDMAYSGLVADGRDGSLVQAVASTRGLVLIHRDQVVPAFFHASSGGRTESVRNRWPERRCPDGTTSLEAVYVSHDDQASTTAARAQPRAGWGTWEARIGPDALAGLLREALGRSGSQAVGTVRVSDLRIARRFADSGRVDDLVLHGTRNGKAVSARMDGATARSLLGGVKVRSTWWTGVEVHRDGSATITGRGFGHGVGLSQAGARAMAKAGHGFRSILETYYHAVRIEKRY